MWYVACGSQDSIHECVKDKVRKKPSQHVDIVQRTYNHLPLTPREAIQAHKKSLRERGFDPQNQLFHCSACTLNTTPTLTNKPLENQNKKAHTKKRPAGGAMEVTTW
jgi:hypothetical protein